MTGRSRPGFDRSSVVHHVRETVQPSAIDEFGHANNASYLAWVQQAITSFWRSVGRPADVTRLVWVALRHEIDYRKATVVGDVLDIEVSVLDYAGAKATFDTVVCRDGDIVARARSVLCCLDAVSMKPIRISPDLASPFWPD